MHENNVNISFIFIYGAYIYITSKVFSLVSGPYAITHKYVLLDRFYDMGDNICDSRRFGGTRWATFFASDVDRWSQFRRMAHVFDHSSSAHWNAVYWHFVSGFIFYQKIITSFTNLIYILELRLGWYWRRLRSCNRWAAQVRPSHYFNACWSRDGSWSI